MLVIGVSAIPISTPFPLRVLKDANYAIARAFGAEGEAACLIGADGKIEQVFPEFHLLEDTDNLVAAPAQTQASAIQPATVESAAIRELVYAVGRVGYDFGHVARRDALFQHAGGQVNVENPDEFLQYLKGAPFSAAAVIWTLRINGVPVYALRPSGAYATAAYELLAESLGAQRGNGAYMVSAAGRAGGYVQLATGHTVPVIEPIERSITGWDPESLVTAALGPAPQPEQDPAYKQRREQVYSFLMRIYEEVRNLGVKPQERALNFAVAKGFQLATVFVDALSRQMALAGVRVAHSPIGRPGSDCWDVVLSFFRPDQRWTQARREYRFTVDVSDVVPVTVGQPRSWSAY